MNDCVFCKIVDKKIPADVVYETDDLLAFNDINPQAPVHILLIPKKHIKNVVEINPDDGKILIGIHQALKQIVMDSNIEQSGFRVVTNKGVDGGQEVEHVHFHILGGRKLAWPPG